MMWSRIKNRAAKNKTGEQAAQELLQTLQREPGNAGAHHALGQLHAEQGDLAQAEESFCKAVSLQPGNTEFLASLAQLFFNTQRFADAASIYESLLALEESNAAAHCGLGAALARLGDIEGGLAHLEKAAALAPEVAEMWVELGIAQFRQSAYEQAADSFKHAIRCRPEFSEAHNNLGLTLRTLARHEEAEQHLRQAVRHAPGNVGAWANLADVLALQGRPAEAVEHYKQALALDEDNSRRHFAVGVALAADGNLQDALTYYRSAIGIDPDFPAAHCNLGLVLAELGKADEAEAALRRAADLAPDDKAIAANLRVVAGSRIQRRHFPMMNDTPRNAAYDSAIREHVNDEVRVLEIGTGSGLLAMMAAQAGAAHVTACETIRPLALKAHQIVSKNGFRRKVAVIGKHSAALKIPGDMPERADVLISEIISSDLLGEGLLDTMEDAVQRLIKPGAVIIPARAAIVGQLAGSPRLDQYLRVGTVWGFDPTPFNEFSPITLEPAEFGIQMDLFSDRIDLFEFDFQESAVFPAQEKRIAVPCTASGICHGVLQWIRLDLSTGNQFENAPGTAGTGSDGQWRQTLYSFAEPVFIEQGQVVHLVAAHNRSNLMFYLDRIE